ncbi:MAG: hypothetical protein NTX38_12620 [Methylobacter sp.]|nr:hypothetical protein [Methylobacter sp.]
MSTQKCDIQFEISAEDVVTYETLNELRRQYNSILFEICGSDGYMPKMMSLNDMVVSGGKKLQSIFCFTMESPPPFGRKTIDIFVKNKIVNLFKNGISTYDATDEIEAVMYYSYLTDHDKDCLCRECINTKAEVSDGLILQ